ncbi:hypothetical protein GCM10027184_00110 [Saccharothrix stipae]
MVGHRVVEPEPALADELEHHGGDERLGHAGDADPATRVGRLPGAQVTDSRRTTPGVALVDDGRVGTGHSARHHLAERVAHGRAGTRLRSGHQPGGQRRHQPDNDTSPPHPHGLSLPDGPSESYRLTTQPAEGRAPPRGSHGRIRVPVVGPSVRDPRNRVREPVNSRPVVGLAPTYGNHRYAERLTEEHLNLKVGYAPSLNERPVADVRFPDSCNRDTAVRRGTDQDEAFPTAVAMIHL